MAHDKTRPKQFGAYDILDLAQLIRKKYWTIAVYVGVFVLLATTYSLFSNSYYRSQTILSPAAHDLASSSTGALLGSLGSLLSEIGNPCQRDLLHIIAVLESRSFTLDFLTAINAQPLPSPEFWDGDKKEWKATKTGLLSSIRSVLGNRTPIRDAETYRHDVAFHRFSRSRSVNVENAAQLVTLNIEWTDPIIAANWVNTMVTLLNEHARQRKIQESTLNIQYLRAEIESTNIVSAHTALYSLLEQELRSSIIANVRREYALQVIDPAVPANSPVSTETVAESFPSGSGWNCRWHSLHLLLSVYLNLLAEAKETSG